MKVKCKKCGYEWDTQSRMMNVNCPSCRRPTKIRDTPTKQN